jgi:DNA replication protein DnaC
MASSQSIEKVLKQYQLRRDKHQIESDQILFRVYNKYPELLRLRREYASLRTSSIRTKSQSDVEKYQEVYTNYQVLLGSCLHFENIPIEKVVYQPICSKCNDTGFIGKNEKKHCPCVIAKAAQNMLESSCINDYETIENYNLDIFNDSTKVQGNLTQKDIMQKLLNYIKEWTSSFPNSKKQQLLFIGNVGMGKTYCLNSIAYDIINRGYSSMLVTAFAINEAAFDEIRNHDSTAINTMQTVDLLLIDDLGSEQMLKNITQETLFNILNERVRHNLHTIVSTNLHADKLEERYGSRVYSRLIDKNRTNILPLMGKDIRSK